jgi:DNA-binding NarL/FixJ family response regulator
LLIVDDRAQVRHELRDVLPLAGELAGLPIEIIGEARDGREAVELAGALRPDLVLMDLEMPVLDGYDATRKIKAISPSIRVIVLTVHDDAQARCKASQAGADGFIVKGEPIREMIQTIYSLK